MDDPNGIVRATAAEVEKKATIARRLGLALLAVGVAGMLLAAGFSAYNASQLRDQTVFNEEFLRLVQDYNEAHADAAGKSFEAVETDLRCMANYFFALSAGTAPPKADLDACFVNVTPQPAPPKKEGK